MNSTSAEQVSIQALWPASAAASTDALSSSSSAWEIVAIAESAVASSSAASGAATSCPLTSPVPGRRATQAVIPIRKASIAIENRGIEFTFLEWGSGLPKRCCRASERSRECKPKFTHSRGFRNRIIGSVHQEPDFRFRFRQPGSESDQKVRQFDASAGAGRFETGTCRAPVSRHNRVGQRFPEPCDAAQASIFGAGS